MFIYLDENGYVNTYAIIGNLVDGIEIAEPTDVSHFEAHYSAYHIIDNKLVFDEAQEQVVELEAQKTELRERRQKECFSIVDRSKLWYDSLTSDQLKELQDWYNAWLIVTETMVVPAKPEWL